MKAAFLLPTILSAFLALGMPARAGDTASLDILGFSADGGVFAFEEYGVQDGSGFPYANRYYIDTATDEFLPGTPVRVRLEDENATVASARDQARKLGEKVVEQAVLDANHGFTAGFNAITEYSADPHRMAVNPRPVFHPIDPAFEVRLEEIPMQGSEVCQSQGENLGFRLLRIDASKGGQTQYLHEDAKIPQSRGCPNGYRIGAIQTFETGNSLTSYAVLVSVRQYGFEGPDHRWIAVTGRF